MGHFFFFLFQMSNGRTSSPIAYNGFGLGEVAFVRWLVCREDILPNPCYALVAVLLAGTSIGARFFVLFLWMGKNVNNFFSLSYCVYDIHSVCLYQKLKQTK